MAKLVISKFSGGIGEGLKVGAEGSFYFGKRLDIYQDPNSFTILPKTVKVSGTTVDALVKWIVPGTPHDTNKYFYAENGKIFQETSAGAWSSLRTVASSVGQGLEVSNDYLYYTQNTQIGRYGPLSSSPTFTDNWQTGLNDTSTTKYAPIKATPGGGLVVGHGNKISYWDGATWTLARLTLPAGLHVRAIEVVDEYIIFGTWRGTAITDNNEGYAFYWDEAAETFNFVAPLPAGGINALINFDNQLLTVGGSKGDIYLGSSPFQKIKRIPLVGPSKYMEVLPGAVTNYQGFACIGTSGNTDSTTLIQGVYFWGYPGPIPDCLNYAHTISTGTETGTTLKIGALKGIGNALYIGWRDGSTYGVDKVLPTNDPYASATYEALIYDAKNPGDDKRVDLLKATHRGIAANESVQLGHKINRTTSYTTDTANSTADTIETRMNINNGLFSELQGEVILVTTTTTAPTVTSLSILYDPLESETSY